MKAVWIEGLKKWFRIGWYRNSKLIGEGSVALKKGDSFLVRVEESRYRDGPFTISSEQQSWGSWWMIPSWLWAEITDVTRPDQTVRSFGFRVDKAPRSLGGSVELRTDAIMGHPVTEFDYRKNILIEEFKEPPQPVEKALTIKEEDRYVRLGTDDNGAVIDLGWGGLVRQVNRGGWSKLYDPPHAGPGGSLQVDGRERIYKGSPPGSFKFETTLMPTQGGNQFTGRDPFNKWEWEWGKGAERSPIYSLSTGGDTLDILNRCSVRSRLRYYWVDYRQHSTLSDWICESEYTLRGPHLLCEWTLYLRDGAEPRQVHDLAVHAFLDKRYSGDLIHVANYAGTNSYLTAGFHGPHFWSDAGEHEWRDVGHPLVKEQTLHLFSRRKLNWRTVLPGEKFKLRAILSPDMVEAFKVFDIEGEIVPQKKDQPIKSLINGVTFFVTREQFEAAQAADALGVEGAPPLLTATYAGTEAQFNARFPVPDDKEEPDDPVKPDPEFPAWPTKQHGSDFANLKAYLWTVYKALELVWGKVK